MSLPEAIFFDLDDTILIEDAASRKAWEETAQTYATKMGLCESDGLLKNIKAGAAWFWSDPGRRQGAVASFFQARLTYVKIALHELGRDDDELAENIVTTFTEMKDKYIRFYPNARETVKHIAARGIKLALLTNGDASIQRKRVERFGLPSYFPVCLIEGEVGFGKPDPRIFRMALEKSKVSPENTWMVGDLLETDIIGARGVGIHSIWCDYEGKGLPQNPPAVPDRTIHNISELLALLKE